MKIIILIKIKILKKSENLLENLRKITFEKKFTDDVALTTTFSEQSREKPENPDLPAASPTLLRHPYHSDKGDQRGQ